MKKGVFIWFCLVIFLISLVLAAPSFHTTGTRSYGLEDSNPSITYNFSYNVSNPDNDTLIYTIEEVKSTKFSETNASFYHWIDIDSSTGILTINSTLNNQSDNYNISMTVLNSVPEGQTSVFYFNINETNDAPSFSGLENQSFNMSDLFEEIIDIVDEESDTPYTLNITFLSCGLAQWSTKEDCILFNESDYSFNDTTGVLNISFTPVRNDVGYYIMNFSVKDLNNEFMPYNQTTELIINYTVINVNSYPWFTYICDNERTATEDSLFSCYINASDIDETNNLTYVSDYSWFLTSNVSVHNATTNFNSSVLINFTPSDVNVGNWSITINATDTGNPVRTNSTSFYFYIDNINDSVNLNTIDNLSAYQGNVYNVLINATDDDLLIPDESVYDESIIFSYVNSTGDIPSWLSLISGSEAGNSYTSYLRFTANSDIAGDYVINVSARDANNYSISSKTFNITVITNTAPYWVNLNSTFYGNESTEFYLNLSEYVNDSDGDSLTFSSSNLSYFPGFNIDSDTGVINFTPSNLDVGFQQIYFNVTDGKTPNSTLVYFNISNLNNAPYIEKPLTVVNASRDINSNINATEDNYTTITIWIQDDDFKIPQDQKIYYNESITLNVSIQGPDTNLFSFSKDNDFPSPSFPNKTKYVASFTPNKGDVGNYNITINASDLYNSSNFISFNLTVFSINHAPVLMELSNQTSSVNRSFYYRINASDIEDANTTNSGNTNLTFSYNFINGTDFFNSSVFNVTSGEINISFNDSQYGKYRINISVNDTNGLIDYSDFWLFVYENPLIDYPVGSYDFSLIENQNSNLSFNASHSVGDNLTYYFYIQNVLRYNVSSYGNSSLVYWSFTPNYTDETYGDNKNLTLTVVNEIYSDINSSYTWNISINHTNSPVRFSGYIGDKQTTTDRSLSINLINYFIDDDYSDVHYNQSINFSLYSNSTPSYLTFSESDWNATITALIALEELVNVSATDGIDNASSNDFNIVFTEPSVQTVSTPSSGGGGGGSSKPISFKLISPDPISAYKNDRIILPIRLENTGKIEFKDISLSAFVAKDGLERNDVSVDFDKTSIDKLKVDDMENITMTIIANTNDVGLFEITINATSKSPVYSDWTKLYLTVNETDQIQEKLLFTEELIAENPECIELRELLEESKKYYDEGNFILADKKAQEAIDACKQSISQSQIPSVREVFENKLYSYSLVGSLVVFFAGIFYYSYKRMKLRRLINFRKLNKQNSTIN